INGLSSGLIFLVISLRTEFIPSDEWAAFLSANGGEYSITSSTPTLCQIGRIKSFFSTNSLVVNPFSSRLAQGLLKKLGLRTTIPNLDLARPSSIFCVRLSPMDKENSSYQTSMCCC